MKFFCDFSFLHFMLTLKDQTIYLSCLILILISKSNYYFSFRQAYFDGWLSLHLILWLAALWIFLFLVISLQLFVFYLLVIIWLVISQLNSCSTFQENWYVCEVKQACLTFSVLQVRYPILLDDWLYFTIVYFLPSTFSFVLEFSYLFLYLFQIE